MTPFTALLDGLVLTPSRNTKVQILKDYFRNTPDPDRGYAVAAITRDLSIASVKPAMVRGLVEERVDAELFRLSYDHVGDMAETIALIWPPQGNVQEQSLSNIVNALQSVGRGQAPALVTKILDSLDASGRWAFLKLITGGLRIGVSSRLIKQALAGFGNVDVTEIEELWHGLMPPYTELFNWLEGKADKPVNLARSPFRPVMLSHALEEKEHSLITPDVYAAEWKWDGIRVQAVCEDGEKRLYTRTGDDISHAFPDVIGAMDFEASLDGELLVYKGMPGDNGLYNVSSFGDLQQRLNRKTVSKKQLENYPAFLRVYDLLHEGDENTRPLPFVERRARLEAFIGRHMGERMDLSPLVSYDRLEDLDHMRTNPPHRDIEGVMLKRWDSLYEPGRPKGPWFKWKKAPYLIDAVLMYAQRGHGKRSGYYSDYTFGVWKGSHNDAELVPVGKAYFGFTDEELKRIDKFVRENTIERFGPVRSVIAQADHGLVLEVAFEGLNSSTRHKSGVAMRFPRISRLRWDKPPHEADRIEALEALLG